MLLPSLDRLAELIERIVALLDDVSLAPVPAAAPTPKPRIRPPAADGWVAFVPSPDGYGLLEREGGPPEAGAAVELDGEILVVLRLGPSPLPGDRRRCAYLGQEPLAPERTLDR
ncbi:MAG TPA: hypothetical protein VM049_03935 [Gaiellaceae bacterium]|nr:hypothetical protein [Gaiellaceae bacterium]